MKDSASLYRSAVVALCLGVTLLAWPQTNRQPQFIGIVAVEWIENPSGPDREMVLLNEFRLRDLNGKEWVVPKGAVIDGASIPRAFWTLVGPPFVGDYRRASVIHDHYCKTKEEGWLATHRMFYDGMIAGGVPSVDAKVMYAAVYGGGPRWSRISGVVPGSPAFHTVYPELTEAEMARLEEWIELEAPDLRLIERRIDQGFER